MIHENKKIQQLLETIARIEDVHFRLQDKYGQALAKIAALESKPDGGIVPDSPHPIPAIINSDHVIPKDRWPSDLKIGIGAEPIYVSVKDLDKLPDLMEESRKRMQDRVHKVRVGDPGGVHMQTTEESQAYLQQRQIETLKSTVENLAAENEKLKAELSAIKNHGGQQSRNG